MKLQTLKKRLIEHSLFQEETRILGFPGLIGYKKKFRWFPTAYLHTYLVATDFGEKELTLETFAEHFLQVNTLLPAKYSGYLGAISILISANPTEEVKEFALYMKPPRQLSREFLIKLREHPGYPKPDNRISSSEFTSEDTGTFHFFASSASTFRVPVVINSRTGEIFRFKKKPFVGRVHYSYFEKLLKKLFPSS